MRLLHAKTLEFEVFHDDEIPEYVILSHTWEDEEVSYQEMRFCNNTKDYQRAGGRRLFHSHDEDVCRIEHSIG